MKGRQSKPESAAWGYTFRYSAAVASKSLPCKAALSLGLLVCGGCASLGAGRGQDSPSTEFYTVTAELALARGEGRVAALQYAAAADENTDPQLLQRAAEVSADALQPTLTAAIAARWISVEPSSTQAQRAAARAALSLYRVDAAAAHYLALLNAERAGAPAAFEDFESDLDSDDNVFGARAVADRIAMSFPRSPTALRVQGMAALRADDPAAAVRSLSSALAAEPSAEPAATAAPPAANPKNDAAGARHDLQQILQRARILAGDVEQPLENAQQQLRTADTAANRFDYAMLLMAAQRDAAAAQQLEILAAKPESKAVALRLLALLEFQQGNLQAAAAHFRQLIRTGQFLDDGYYYLGVAADRDGDPERALRLYSQVQHGENVVAALLRAGALLHTHGAPDAAEELLDRLLEDEPQRAPDILSARARMYADGGDLSKADEMLQQALVNYPDSVELRYAQVAVLEEQGRIDQALRALSRVLKQRPGDPAAQNALGYTLADHHQHLSRARKLIERAHAAAPRNPAILDSLGWVLYRQGRSVQALTYLHAAYADDHSGDIAAHLGEVLWQQGKHAEAQHIWSTASSADADNKLLKSTRQRLEVN